MLLRELHRVLKPGGRLVFMADDRTARRLRTALEAAGFEIEALRGLDRPWASLKRGKVNAELDQLAIDPEGRLVLIELKDGALTGPLPYAPCSCFSTSMSGRQRSSP